MEKLFPGYGVRFERMDRDPHQETEPWELEVVDGGSYSVEKILEATHHKKEDEFRLYEFDPKQGIISRLFGSRDDRSILQFDVEDHQYYTMDDPMVTYTGLIPRKDKGDLSEALLEEGFEVIEVLGDGVERIRDYSIEADNSSVSLVPE